MKIYPLSWIPNTPGFKLILILPDKTEIPATVQLDPFGMHRLQDENSNWINIFTLDRVLVWRNENSN